MPNDDLRSADREMFEQAIQQPAIAHPCTHITGRQTEGRHDLHGHRQHVLVAVDERVRQRRERRLAERQRDGGHVAHTGRDGRAQVVVGDVEHLQGWVGSGWRGVLGTAGRY